jgi:hypothetical protein
LRLSVTPQAAIRGILSISSTSYDPHNTTCFYKSWAKLENRFPVASMYRVAARLGSVSWRFWVGTGRCRMYGRQLSKPMGCNYLYLRGLKLTHESRSRADSSTHHWLRLALLPSGVGWSRDIRLPAAIPDMLDLSNY